MPLFHFSPHRYFKGRIKECLNHRTKYHAISRRHNGLSPRRISGNTITATTSAEVQSNNLRFLRSPSPSLATLLTEYLTKPSQPLTLSKLLSYGKPLTAKSTLQSAAYVLAEIPRLLSRRSRALENLPFIVGTNPYITRTLDAHRRSFEWLATYPAPTSLDENSDFVDRLEHLVQSHANDIPTIARGFKECGRYMSSYAINDFLDLTIRNRITVRLIAEQHIALSRALGESSGHKANLGVISEACVPAEMINICSQFVAELCEATYGTHPRLEINGHTEAIFSYVSVHFQYILTELLKNAFRASIEKHWQLYGMSSIRVLPAVTVTIAAPQPTETPDEAQFISIRIRDEGGGISPSNLNRVFSYAFTTAGRNVQHADEADGGPYAAQHIGGSAAIGEGVTADTDGGNLFSELTGKGVQTSAGTLAGLGYGLPMSRLYARYFGGSLDLYSLDGLGTDAIVKLRCLGEGQDIQL